MKENNLIDILADHRFDLHHLIKNFICWRWVSWIEGKNDEYIYNNILLRNNFFN